MRGPHASGAEVPDGSRQRLAIQKEIPRLSLSALRDDAGVDQHVGMMAEQSQTDTDMFGHLRPCRLTTTLAQEVHNTEARRLPERLEDGGPLVSGGR